MVDRKDQKDHHLYPPGFELTVGSVKRYVEYKWVASHCKGLKVMDLGCNTGFGSAIVAKEAAEVVGVDVSKEALDVAEEEFKDNAKLSWVHVTEGDLPYDQGPFDAVIILNIIEHFPDAADMLEKIHRILKPGGKLILTTVNRKLRIFAWQKPWNRLHHKEYDVRSLKKEVGPWFPEMELTGMRSVGTFFPDLLKKAWSRKWRTGIKGPFRRFLSNTKRKLTGQPMLPKQHISEAVDRPAVPDTQKQVVTEADRRDFYKTADEIIVEKMNMGKSIKLMAVCTRR